MSSLSSHFGSTSSLKKLEDMATCAIHLGMLEDARILPCGHVFCCSCLDKYMRRKLVSTRNSAIKNGEITFDCPICRTEVGIKIDISTNNQMELQIVTNASKLPKAFTQNDLVEYIIHQRNRRCKNSLRRSATTPTPGSNNESGQSSTFDSSNDVTLISSERVTFHASHNDLTTPNTLQQQVTSPYLSIPQQNNTLQLPVFSNNRASSSCVNQMGGTASVPIRMGSSRAQSVNDNDQTPPTMSEYELYDQDTIKENMRNLSRYRIRSHVDVGEKKQVYSLSNKIGLSCGSSKHPKAGACSEYCNESARRTSPGNSLVDAALWEDEDNRCFTMIMIDHNEEETNVPAIAVNHQPIATNYGNKILSYNSLNTSPPSPLKITIDPQCRFSPMFIKVYNNYLYMSGLIEDNTNVTPSYGLIIKCDLNGEIVARSPAFVSDNPSFPAVCGFSIDANDVLVAVTGKSQISKLTVGLEDTGVFLSFDNMHHPTYLLRKPENEEIWVSCSFEGRILIVDEKTGQFATFGTDKIYSSVPSHLTLTSDGRLVFLDSRQNRVFWIKRRNQNILIQRLLFDSPLNKDTRILAISALSNERLLVTSTDRVFVTKPIRSITRNSHRYSHCSIL